MTGILLPPPASRMTSNSSFASAAAAASVAAAGRGGRGCSNRHRGGRGDVEGLLEGLDELSRARCRDISLNASSRSSVLIFAMVASFR